MAHFNLQMYLIYTSQLPAYLLNLELELIFSWKINSPPVIANIYNIAYIKQFTESKIFQYFFLFSGILFSGMFCLSLECRTATA